MHYVVLLTATLMTLFCAPATVRPPSRMPPPVDAGSIIVREIDPTAGTPLHRGARVTFTVTADYNLTGAESGAVTLVIQDQRNRNLVSGEQPSKQVRRGRGQVTLVSTVVVPPKWVDKIVVFLPLSASGHRATKTAAVVEYPVVK
jgi:hypothetical protein